jgi:hypothetical protein
LAYNRLTPLKRCLHSLSTAEYGSDRVDLHIHLDHFKQPESKNLSVVDENLESDHQILEFLDGFHWPNGDKEIIYNSENRGLQAQWIEAWWPRSDDEFAFVVEDDLELSPLFYKFLKKAIITYYYDKSNYHPSIFGISLQRPRFVAGLLSLSLSLSVTQHAHKQAPIKLVKKIGKPELTFSLESVDFV